MYMWVFRPAYQTFLCAAVLPNEAKSSHGNDSQAVYSFPDDTECDIRNSPQEKLQLEDAWAAAASLAPCDGEHFASNSLEENQYVGDAWGPAAPRAPCDVGIPIADWGQQLEAHPLDTQV